MLGYIMMPSWYQGCCPEKKYATDIVFSQSNENTPKSYGIMLSQEVGWVRSVSLLVGITDMWFCFFLPSLKFMFWNGFRGAKMHQIWFQIRERETRNKSFYFTGIALQLVLNKTAVENYVEYSIFQLKHGLPTVAFVIFFVLQEWNVLHWTLLC